MRQTIAGLIAGAALAATMGAAAPAQACAVVDPCARGYGGYGYDYGYYGYGVRERLPNPAVQYYYVNRGPTYTGPGNYAPVPTYQERAVNGWQGYSRPYRYGYDGGPYANPTSHYYDGAPNVHGPMIYRYRGAYKYRGAYRYHVRRSRYRPHRVAPPPKYYYAARPSIRYGYRAGPRINDVARLGRAPHAYGAGHGMMHRHQGMARAPHYAAPRTIRPGSKPHYHSF
jgi:hypothetical protein